jgi:type I restriction enzyme S subunit
VSAATSNHPFKNQQPVRRSLGEVGSSIVNRTAWNASHPMTLDTFFKKFDQFADAPDAVAKMRELILWSAFSGAFSGEKRDQPMPDEWASGDAPILPSIPSSWTWQRGRDVFNVIRGVTYSKSDASNAQSAGTFPILRANNIGKGVNFESLVFVPKSKIKEEQFLRAGDILIAMSSGSKKLVGKAAPILSDFPGAFGAFCGVIRNKSKMPDAVLARYFETPQYTSWVTAAGKGIGINNIGKGDLESLPVPTPPLAEQKRIVAKVDELMALCDRLEAQQQERDELASALARASLARFAEAPTPANLNLLFHKSYSIPPGELRKAILTLAVRGKLLRQDAKDESASVLLTRITQQRPVNSINSAEKPFEVPDNWHWVRLGDLVESMSNGIYKPAKFYNEAGTACVRMYNIQDGKLDLAKLKRLDLAQNEVDQYRLEVGDLLVNRVNSRELVGKCGIVEANDEPLVYEAMNIRIRLVERNNLPSYVNLVLRTDRVRDIFQNSSKQAIGQASINQPQVASVAIPLPPLAEHCRILAKSLLEALVGELTNVNRS